MGPASEREAKAAASRIRCQSLRLRRPLRASEIDSLHGQAGGPPYRSSTDTQTAGIHEFCTTNRYRARKPLAIPSTRLYRTYHEQPVQNDPQCAGAPSCESALADKEPEAAYASIRELSESEFCKLVDDLTIASAPLSPSADEPPIP
jgi:hypothetical protein